MRHATAKPSEQHNRKAVAFADRWCRMMLIIMRDACFEDTAGAVSEARTKGINVFAVTVDRLATRIRPHFGHGGYSDCKIVQASGSSCDLPHACRVKFQ